MLPIGCLGLICPPGTAHPGGAKATSLFLCFIPPGSPCLGFWSVRQYSGRQASAGLPPIVDSDDPQPNEAALLEDLTFLTTCFPQCQPSFLEYTLQRHGHRVADAAQFVLRRLEEAEAGNSDERCAVEDSFLRDSRDSAATCPDSSSSFTTSTTSPFAEECGSQDGGWATVRGARSSSGSCSSATLGTSPPPAATPLAAGPLSVTASSAPQQTVLPPDLSDAIRVLRLADTQTTPMSRVNTSQHRRVAPPRSRPIADDGTTPVDVAQIRAIFPDLDPAEVAARLARSSDIHAVIDELLSGGGRSATPSADPSPGLTAADPQFEILRTMFPDHTSAQLRDTLARYENLDAAVNALLNPPPARSNYAALSRPPAPASTGRFGVLAPKATARPAGPPRNQSLAAPPPTSSSSPSLDGFRAPRRGRNHALAATRDEDDNEADRSLEHCHAMVEHYTQKRHTAFTAAADAFTRRNKLGNHSGTALYYSMEGKRADGQLKAWQNREARALVEHQRRRADDPYLLDLHMVYVKQAMAIVVEDLDAWYAAEMAKPNVQTRRCLKIVTGL
ncbi:hypothetical protein IWQ60_006410, partial [Tieghemiomyces parasiticus]